MIELIDIYLGNKTIVETELRFVSDLFEKNPECIELKELLTQAEDALEKQEFEKAKSLAKAAVETCRNLIGAVRRTGIERPSPPPIKDRTKLIYNIIIAILLLALFISLYTRRGAPAQRRGKWLGIFKRILSFISMKKKKQGKQIKKLVKSK